MNKEEAAVTFRFLALQWELDGPHLRWEKNFKKKWSLFWKGLFAPCHWVSEWYYHKAVGLWTWASGTIRVGGVWLASSLYLHRGIECATEEGMQREIGVKAESWGTMMFRYPAEKGGSKGDQRKGQWDRRRGKKKNKGLCWSQVQKEFANIKICQHN